MNVSKRLLCLLGVGLISSTALTGYLKANTTELDYVLEQQQAVKKVQGIVTDKTGEPLIGVSVAIQGTSTGTITDIDGKYEITLTENKPLTFTYIGYVTQTIPVTQSTLDVVLAENSVALDELVVVGYGVQKKENLTGAVSSVDVAKTMDSRPISDVGRALQGAVPGLTITSSTGEIGSSPSIKIRGGVGSANGKSDPLILVDNVVIPDLNLVNPDDIESISVLKDAASTSIYGARAAFGVILITTKSKNKNDQFRVSYTNNFAWRKPTVKAEQLPGWQQAEINLAGEQRLGNPQYSVVGGITVNQEVVDKMKAWADQYGSGKGLGSEMVYGRDFEFNQAGEYNFYRTWDWYDMFYKEWTPQQTHNLSISGGNEKTNYNIALGYLYQDGVTKKNTDNYNRYNASMSINTQAYKWLSLRASMMYTRTNRETPFVYNSTNAELYDYMYYLYRWQPMYPYGTYEGKPFRGAIAELEQAPMNKKERDYLRFGGGATINVTSDLTIDADFIYTTTDDRNKMSSSPVFAYDFWGKNSLQGLTNSYGNYITPALDYLQQSSAHTELYTTNAYATYVKKISDHSFKGMVGTNIESSTYNNTISKKNGLFDSNYPEFNLANGTSEIRGSNTHWAVLGFFSRINYSYKDRYLVEVNGRYDGSSRFPSEDRWGFFPSISAGYRISEENFMQSLYPAVSSLKLRGSYGSIGNQDVGDNAFLSMITANPSYPWYVDGSPTVSMQGPSVVRRSLSWEKVKTIDFGLDARFLNDKLGVTFDWYKRTTSDMLSAGESLPAGFGAAAPKQNYGELETPGWELAVDYNHQFSNGLRITLGAQITDYYTKVKKWSKSENNIPIYGDGGKSWYGVQYYRTNMRLGDIWGYKVDRLFQADDFDATGKLKPGIPTQDLTNGKYTLMPGDVKYKDLDGDGKITQGKGTSDDHGDKTVIGNIFPRYQYGFTIAADYKGFDVNIFFQGVGQRKIWAGGNMVLPGYTSGEPYFKGADDYWTPENTGAFYPRPTVYSQAMSFNYEVNDRYLLNMAYLRCKTLTLGYTIPRAMTQKAYINNLRVYVTAENLFDFNKLKDVPVDPETGITTGSNAAGVEQTDPRNFGRSYPYQRTLSFGIQLTL